VGNVADGFLCFSFNGIQLAHLQPPATAVLAAPGVSREPIEPWLYRRAAKQPHWGPGRESVWLIFACVLLCVGVATSSARLTSGVDTSSARLTSGVPTSSARLTSGVNLGVGRPCINSGVAAGTDVATSGVAVGTTLRDRGRLPWMTAN